MASFRLGIADRLDARPLAWGFLKGHHNDLFEPMLLPGERIAPMLSNGDLDGGLVSPLDLATASNVSVVPDLCVCVDGPSHAALLQLRTAELEDIARIGVGKSEGFFPVVLEAILRELHDRCPTIEVTRAAGGSIPEGFDGYLMEGEEALTQPWEAPTTLDLTAEWQRLTALPLVLSLWAVREGVALPDLAFYFKSSLRYGLASIDTLCRETGAGRGVRINRTKRYLAEQLRYVLGERERDGVLRLLTTATGESGEPPEIRYLDS